MNASRLVIDIGNALAFSGAGICWTFCCIYSYFARWWRSEGGVHLFSFTLSMAVILTYVSWRIIWPVDRVEMLDLVIRAAIFGIEAILAGWRLSILVRKQTGARQRRGQIGNRRNSVGGRHSSQS